MRTAFLLLSASILSLNLSAQTAPSMNWDKSFGGNDTEYGMRCIPTSDGNFLLFGTSSSAPSGDRTAPLKNGSLSADFWVVKMDPSGNKIWDKAYGGTGSDVLHNAITAPDGGYLLAGLSDSPVSGEKSEASRGDRDFWVIKIDVNGNKVWDKTLGGDFYESVACIAPTIDGGYLVGGSSLSGLSGDKTQASYGNYDMWVVKLSSTGTKLWDKSFGGTGGEGISVILPQPDGSAILCGTSDSDISGTKTQATRGYTDFYLVKINTSGAQVWDKALGGSGIEQLNTAFTTADGFILGGWSYSFASGDKTSNTNGASDFWLIKLNTSANLVWDKSFGGIYNEFAFTVVPTVDGGYLMGGSSESPAGFDVTTASKGDHDFWVVKTDGSGNKQWVKSIGSHGEESIYSIVYTSDGGYLLMGKSASWIPGGDKTSPSKGGMDFWVVKIGSTTALPNMPAWSKHLLVYPNPVADKLVISNKEVRRLRLQLYDIAGNLLVDKLIRSADAVIYMNRYAAGVYDLIATDVKNNEQAAFKLVKQ